MSSQSGHSNRRPQKRTQIVESSPSLAKSAKEVSSPVCQTAVHGSSVKNGSPVGDYRDYVPAGKTVPKYLSSRDRIDTKWITVLPAISNFHCHLKQKNWSSSVTFYVELTE